MLGLSLVFMFCFTESRKIHLPFHKKVFVIVHGIFVSSSFSYVIVKSHLINEKPKNLYVPWTIWSPNARKLWMQMKEKHTKQHRDCLRMFSVIWLMLFSFFCPRYQLMLNCWNEAADKRPTFPKFASIQVCSMRVLTKTPGSLLVKQNV